MREVDRPIEERLSILERPSSDQDLLADDEWPRGDVVDPTAIRLALDDGQHRLYLAPGIDPSHFSIHLRKPSGGSGGIHPRSVLSSKGASVMSSGSGGNPPRIVCGAVSDQVQVVHVNGVEALFGNNAYLAVISSMLETIEVTTPESTRHVEFHPLMR